MEIIDIEGKDGKCIKCHLDLSPDEKKRRVPICTKCITEFVDIAKDDFDADALEEFSNDVRNFTDFVSSSSKLMGLGDIIVVQVCFNIYMDMVRGLASTNRSMARKIFSDARRFIDDELERLEDLGEVEYDKNGDFGNKDFFEKIMGSMEKILKDYHDVQSRNDNVDGKSGNTNNRNFDHIPGKDNHKNEIKEEGESGSKRKRIRVD